MAVGLDTNVIARIVLLDDPRQSRLALEHIAQLQKAGEQVALCLPALLELEWVLRSRARLSKQQTVQVLKHLLEAGDLQIDGEAILERALYSWENSSADFAECMLLAQYQQLGCRAMLTFDAKAARISGVELVSTP